MATAPTPYWVKPAIVIGFFVFPGLYLGCAETSVNKVKTELEARDIEIGDTSSPASASSGSDDEWTPACDTDAVLEALGMTVREYQKARGLYVDGWVGPQTAAFLCAEELPPPAEEIPPEANGTG